MSPWRRRRDRCPPVAPVPWRGGWLLLAAAGGYGWPTWIHDAAAASGYLQPHVPGFFLRAANGDRAGRATGQRRLRIPRHDGAPDWFSASRGDRSRLRRRLA